MNETGLMALQLSEIIDGGTFILSMIGLALASHIIFRIITK